MTNNGSNLLANNNDHDFAAQQQRFANLYGGLAGGFMLLIGLGLIAFAASRVNQTNAFTAQAISVQGQVVRLDSHTSYSDDGSSTKYYTAIIGYTDKAGIQREASDYGTSDRPIREIGDAVPLLYNPSNPAETKVNTFSGLHGQTAVMVGLGLAFAIFGGKFFTLLFRAFPNRLKQ